VALRLADKAVHVLLNSTLFAGSDSLY